MRPGPGCPAAGAAGERGDGAAAEVKYPAAMRPLLSLVFWVFLTTSTFLMLPLAVVVWALTAPFDRRLRTLHLFTCFWASLYTWLNPAWRVSIEGRERIRPGETYVMVANHLSLIDILVLFRLFTHYKWVSKIENFRVPLIGWNMTLNRYIKLRRGDKSSVVRMMKACHETLDGGSSIMMFPEGTRSPTGRMRSFKTGAFEIAKEAHVPILPIVITGSANALPKRGFVLQGRHPIHVTVLEPVAYESFAHESVDQICERTRALIAEQLGEKELARADP
jgi:1-acyl-sn-glycerol-3-phosphate acyltransferase